MANIFSYDNEAHWMDLQDTIAVYTKSEKTRQKLLRKAKKYPGMISYDEMNGKMLAIIPKKCVKLKPTKKIKRMAERDKERNSRSHD